VLALAGSLVAFGLFRAVGRSDPDAVAEPGDQPLAGLGGVGRGPAASWTRFVFADRSPQQVDDLAWPHGLSGNLGGVVAVAQQVGTALPNLPQMSTDERVKAVM
jgi:hypothetical protein